MRIGNLEDLDRSKKQENPEVSEVITEPEETEKQKRIKKRKNWWYYHKWYVICGVILLGIVINLTGNALGIFHKIPDFQVAYIGKAALPQDTISALEQAFASIASDFNGDGQTIVQINQYVDGVQNPDADTAYYEYASEISLIGDISNCESYFFLMDDPDQFQMNFQILASPDGSCPDSMDFSTKDKVIAWSDCPALSEMELGTYSAVTLGVNETGSSQELLSGLSIGRRCFYTDTTAKNASQCSELWDFLYNSR